MTRKQMYGFAAIATAVLSAAGTWSLVHAQQPVQRSSSLGGNNPSNPNQNGPAAGLSGTGSRGMLPQGGGSMSSRGMGPPGGGGMMGWSGMGPAQESDPEMAELAEAEATLAAQAEEMLAEHVNMLPMAKDPADAQKNFKAKLRETLAKQFDAQKQRRELELARIEERLEKLREQIKKRNDASDTIIDRRLEQLINEADGLGWGQPANPNARGMMGAPGKAGKKSSSSSAR